jgi:hypothetical protein
MCCQLRILTVRDHGRIVKRRFDGGRRPVSYQVVCEGIWRQRAIVVGAGYSTTALEKKEKRRACDKVKSDVWEWRSMGYRSAMSVAERCASYLEFAIEGKECGLYRF